MLFVSVCEIVENFSIKGSNIFHKKRPLVKNKKDCASLCYEVEECLFWSWLEEFYVCWLKSSKESLTPSTIGSMVGSKGCGLKGNETFLGVSYSDDFSLAASTKFCT